jgi:hypothetical protein
MKLVDYISDIVNAGLGRRTEGFSESMTPSSVASSLQSLYSSLPIVLVAHFTLMIVYGMGAARLSYCYQMATNPTSYFFYIYVALAFFFSPVYYPFYGIVLNPLCAKSR